jgi:membrane protease YdiL (CAAX protease family)
MTSESPFPAPPPLPSEPRAIRRSRWIIHLLIIAPFPVLIGIVALWRRSSAPALGNGVAGLLTVCAMEFLVFGVFYGGAWLASRASREDLFLRWRPGWAVVPLGAVYSVAMRFAVGIVLLLTVVFLLAVHVITLQEMETFSMANRPKVETLVDVTALRNDPLYFWLNLTLVSFVLGGLREELWRGAFLGGMRSVWPHVFGSRRGQIGAVAIGAMLFGAGHAPQGLLAALMITLVGFALGVIIVVHRSIWPAVFAHGFFDAASMALLPKAMEWMQNLKEQIPMH